MERKKSSESTKIMNILNSYKNSNSARNLCNIVQINKNVLKHQKNIVIGGKSKNNNEQRSLSNSSKKFAKLIGNQGNQPNQAQIANKYKSEKIFEPCVTRDKSKMDYTTQITNRSKSFAKQHVQKYFNFKLKLKKSSSNENTSRNQARSHSPNERNLPIYQKRNMAILKRVVDTKNLITQTYKHTSSKSQLKNAKRNRNATKPKIEIPGNQTESHSRSKCISIGFNILNNTSRSKNKLQIQEENPVVKAKNKLCNEDPNNFKHESKEKIKIKNYINNNNLENHENENTNRLIIPKGNMEINNNYNIAYEAPVQILNLQFPLNRNVTPLKSGKFQNLKIKIDVLNNNNNQGSKQSSNPHNMKNHFVQSQKNIPLSQEQTKTISNDICKSKTKETKIESEKDRLIYTIKNNIRMNNEIPLTTLENYKIIKIIGKGAFAKVTLAEHILTGRKVAIKIIDKAYMQDQNLRKKVLMEVFIQKKIRHKNIIRLFEVFEGNNHLFIVLEYGSGGDLLQYIKSKGRISEREAKRLFRQIVHGIAHIHCKSVIHRDIKLDNIMLDSQNIPKICDFGVSQLILKDQIMKEKCGTPAYLAPEIAVEDSYEGFNADLWSLGIVLFAIVCASVPFKAETLDELREELKNKEISFPYVISSAVQDLIAGLLSVNPYQRLSISEILSHKWLESENKNDKYFYYNDCEQLYESLNLHKPNVNKVFLPNIFRDPNNNGRISYEDYERIIGDNQNNSLDKNILSKLEEFGYPESHVRTSLQKDEINHATATYHLLQCK